MSEEGDIAADADRLQNIGSFQQFYQNKYQNMRCFQTGHYSHQFSAAVVPHLHQSLGGFGVPIVQLAYRCWPIFVGSPMLIGRVAASGLPQGYASAQPSMPLRSEPTGHRNRVALAAPITGLGPHAVVVVEPVVRQKSKECTKYFVHANFFQQNCIPGHCSKYVQATLTNLGTFWKRSH